MGTKLGILLTALLAFSVVPWLLPNGKIIFLCKFLPTKVASCLFNSILFFFQILLSPFPTPVMGFPVDGWARKDPESTRPQHTVHLGQVNTICILRENDDPLKSLKDVRNEKKVDMWVTNIQCRESAERVLLEIAKQTSQINRRWKPATKEVTISCPRDETPRAMCHVERPSWIWHAVFGHDPKDGRDTSLQSKLHLGYMCISWCEGHSQYISLQQICTPTGHLRITHAILLTYLPLKNMDYTASSLAH